MAKCLDCGVEILAEHMSEPCPTCGSLDRAIAAADYATGTDAPEHLGIHEPTTPARSWREQWDRIARWHARVRSTSAGRAHDLTTAHYEDEVYALFQAIHHLKDWLLEDLAAPLKRPQDAEDHVKQTECLRWCADLANGSKHLRADHSPRVDPNLRISARDYSVTFGADPPMTVAGKFTVTGAGRRRDAMDLADESIAKWTKFLDDRGLLN